MPPSKRNAHRGHLSATLCAAAALGACLAGAAPAAGDPPEPAGPLALPLFDGEPERTHQPPAGAFKRPVTPNYRELYDMVNACWPEKSWFRGELSLEMRASTKTRNGTATLDPASGTVVENQDRSVALVAHIPLVSATELDKDRNREMQRHGQVADAVAELVSSFAERVMNQRQLGLVRALEKRAQERVALGVAETAEQVALLEKSFALESKIQLLQAAEIKARLHIVGMCDERRMAGIDSYLATFNGVGR